MSNFQVEIDSITINNGKTIFGITCDSVIDANTSDEDINYLVEEISKSTHDILLSYREMCRNEKNNQDVFSNFEANSVNQKFCGNGCGCGCGKNQKSDSTTQSATDNPNKTQAEPMHQNQESIEEMVKNKLKQLLTESPNEIINTLLKAILNKR